MRTAAANVPPNFSNAFPAASGKEKSAACFFPASETPGSRPKASFETLRLDRLCFGSSGRFPELQSKTVFSPTVEFDDDDINIRLGGLSIASREIPSLLAKHLGMDVCVIVPALNGVDVTKPRWKPLLAPDNLIRVPVVDPATSNTRQAEFQLYKTDYTDPDTQAKLTVYAVADVPDTQGHTYLKQFDSLYLDDPALFDRSSSVYGGKVQKKYENHVAAIALFNRAAAEAVKKLSNPGLKGEPAKNVDVILMHEYLTSLFPMALSKLIPETDKAARVFIAHSKDDVLVDRSMNQVSLADLKTFIPNWRDGLFSIMTAGLQVADVIMGDKHSLQYFSDFLKSRFDWLGNPASAELENPAKTSDFLIDGKSMHYALERLDPKSDEPGELQMPGINFFPLPAMKEANPGSENSLDVMREYKNKNRQALYAMLEALPGEPCFNKDGKVYGHLENRPDTRLFTFLGRFDFAQKGSGLYAKALAEFLTHNPDAQFIMSSREANPVIEPIFMKLAEKFPGRFVFIHGQPNRKILMSGSDFGVVPSLSEAFGLTQLEFMRVGTPIIAHPVGGLASTVDPSRAILMNRLPIEKTQAYDDLVNDNAGSAERRQQGLAAEQEGVVSLVSAFDQANRLSDARRLQMSLNALQYTEGNHSASVVAEERYAPAISAALDKAKCRIATPEKNR